MRSRNGADPRIVVTTSWDDGHPLDLRTAALLSTHGLKGTFYVPVAYSRRPVLELAQLRDLLGMGMEIGSHTLTHPVLPQLNEEAIFRELEGSRKRLEDMLGQPITSLCYPKGKFNRTVRRQAIRAGYRLGRTTMAYHTELSFDPFAMPVSCQFVRQRLDRPIRHALREGNLHGLADWSRWFRLELDPYKLACAMFERILRHGGALHIWGHSWEMDEKGMWPAFVDLLGKIGHRPDVIYATNTEVPEWRQHAPGHLAEAAAW
jgi:peptidoglycan/xylan/chitin deacetylase (PgdA/CDA1 family)